MCDAEPKELPLTDQPDLPDPLQVIPGYESDPACAGTERKVDPELVAAEQDWSAEHPRLAADLKPTMDLT